MFHDAIRHPVRGIAMNSTTFLSEVEKMPQKPPFLFIERVKMLNREQGCIVALLSGGDGRSFAASHTLPPYTKEPLINSGCSAERNYNQLFYLKIIFPA